MAQTETGNSNFCPGVHQTDPIMDQVTSIAILYQVFKNIDPSLNCRKKIRIDQSHNSIV